MSCALVIEHNPYSQRSFAFLLSFENAHLMLFVGADRAFNASSTTHSTTTSLSPQPLPLLSLRNTILFDAEKCDALLVVPDSLSYLTQTPPRECLS